MLWGMYISLCNIRWQGVTSSVSPCHITGCGQFCCTALQQSSPWTPCEDSPSFPPNLLLSANSRHLPPSWRLWEAESEGILHFPSSWKVHNVYSEHITHCMYIALSWMVYIILVRQHFKIHMHSYVYMLVHQFRFIHTMYIHVHWTHVHHWLDSMYIHVHMYNVHCMYKYHPI